MISLYGSRYTMEDYEALYELLRKFSCNHTVDCKDCPIKKVCGDISRLENRVEYMMDELAIVNVQKGKM